MTPPPSRLLLTALLLLLTAFAAQADFRPALVGNGPQVLVNLIDTQKLMAQGQKDALVMFECAVLRDGKAADGITFRDTANSKILAKEVLRALEHSRFMPALYNGKPVAVGFFGTAMFYIGDGKPHLRVFANQSLDDLKQQKDFVAPQLILRTQDSESSRHMLEDPRNTLENGSAEIAIDVDTVGSVKGIRLVAEHPPVTNMGPQP